MASIFLSKSVGMVTSTLVVFCFIISFRSPEIVSDINTDIKNSSESPFSRHAGASIPAQEREGHRLMPRLLLLFIVAPRVGRS